jgi:hypothetical protein
MWPSSTRISLRGTPRSGRWLRGQFGRRDLSSRESVLDREDSHARTRLEARLVVDARKAVLDGLCGHDKKLGNLTLAHAFDAEAQHGDLTVGEFKRPRGVRTGEPCGLDHCADHTWIQQTPRCLSDKLRRRVVERQSWAMRPGLGHCRKRIGRREQATGGGNLGCARAGDIQRR